jgi:glycosyltransferase involved in cell wall biosynthesis
MHQILIASYYFPPDSAVGGLRLSKFARTLPEFGWQPRVLTVRDEYREQGLDPGRLNGLDGISIDRTGEMPNFRRLYLRARMLTKALRWGHESPHRVTSSSVSRAQSDPGGGIFHTLKRYVNSLLVLFPDEKRDWAVPAAFEAVRLIRKHGIDCLLTSSPPESVHLIGLVAKTFTNVRWIADFRDAWIDEIEDRPAQSRSRLSDFLHRRLEALVIARADRILTTTGRLIDAMIARYPGIPREKFVCVPNSIDIEHFRLSSPPGKYSSLTITYAGTLYEGRTPEPLFEAVQSLLESGEATPRDIRIKLLGNCEHINGVDTGLVAKGYGLEEVVEVLKPVPYSEAILIMQQSHLLLVIAPARHHLAIPGKIYDYLGSGSTLLALTEPGATADLMAQTQGGRCFSQSDIAGLRDYLKNLLQDRRFATLRNDPALFDRYTVKRLTERLVAELTAPAGQLARAERCSQ